VDGKATRLGMNDGVVGEGRRGGVSQSRGDGRGEAVFLTVQRDPGGRGPGVGRTTCSWMWSCCGAVCAFALCGGVCVGKS
jgi:hypothetical protein